MMEYCVFEAAASGGTLRKRNIQGENKNVHATNTSNANTPKEQAANVGG